jgi:hypothetical protein
MIRMLLTEHMVHIRSTKHTNVAKMGRSRLGVDQRGCWSFKRVDCDILAKGLIVLIEYSYHQGISSFSKAHPQRTLGSSVFSLK